MSKKSKNTEAPKPSESALETAAAKPVADVPKTVLEHRTELLAGKKGREYWQGVAQHEAAATAHGWARQIYDYPTSPMRITRGDYNQAIQVACVVGDGSSPHAPAMYKREA